MREKDINIPRGQKKVTGSWKEVDEGRDAEKKRKMVTERQTEIKIRNYEERECYKFCKIVHQKLIFFNQEYS